MAVRSQQSLPSPLGAGRHAKPAGQLSVHASVQTAPEAVGVQRPLAQSAPRSHGSPVAPGGMRVSVAAVSPPLPLVSAGGASVESLEQPAATRTANSTQDRSRLFATDMALPSG